MGKINVAITSRDKNKEETHEMHQKYRMNGTQNGGKYIRNSTQAKPSS